VRVVDTNTRRRHHLRRSDNLKKITYPSGRQVAYDFDDDNRLERVYNAVTDATYASDFLYDGAGMLRSYTAGNGIVTTLTYDDETRRVSDIQAGTTQSPGAWLDLGYVYDEVGNVTDITDILNPGQSQTVRELAFTYDNLDRIATADTVNLYGSILFTYDVHGNRTTHPNDTLTFTYDASNPFRLTHIGGVGNYGYSASGNLISQSWPTSASFSYTADNLLDATTQNGVTTYYAYDGQGLRIRKLVQNGPTFYYTRGPSGQLLSEWLNTSGSTATARDYIYAGSILLGVITKTDLDPK
jgi:YD repeat-containing protein